MEAARLVAKEQDRNIIRAEWGSGPVLASTAGDLQIN